jgi:hypothetical protein
VAFIQEKYTDNNRVVAITEMYRIFIPSVGRCRTATVATDDRIDAILIREATEKFMLVVELILDNLKIYTAKVCLDITGILHKDIILITDNLQTANTSSILITMDSNSIPRM